MSATRGKPSTAASPPRWRSIIPTRRLALAFLALLIVTVVASSVWNAVHEQVLSHGDYQLDPRNVEITPLPQWLHADVRSEALRDARLDTPQSILAPDLARRISDAFALHPCVARVVRVTKHHPARVTVQLEYRHPVAMVEVPGGLLPIDGQGVLLPSAIFSPIEAQQYPRLSGIHSAPLGPEGTSWGDPHVQGGAEVASAILPLWKELNLERISVRATESGQTADVTFEIASRGGSLILWGHAPSATAPGELSAVDKIARLKQLYSQHGSLEGKDGPQQLNLGPGAENPQPTARLPNETNTR